MKSSPVTSDTSPRMLRELFLSFCWALSFECCNWFCLHSIENKLYLMFMQTSVLTNFKEQVKPFSPKFLKAELKVAFHCFSVTKCLLPVFSISISAIHSIIMNWYCQKFYQKKGRTYQSEHYMQCIRISFILDLLSGSGERVSIPLLTD